MPKTDAFACGAAAAQGFGRGSVKDTAFALSFRCLRGEDTAFALSFRCLRGEDTAFASSFHCLRG